MENKRYLSVFAASTISIFLFVYFIYVSFSAFGRASDNLQVAIVAGFISLISVFLARYFEQKRELKQKIYTEKIRVYTNLIDILFSFFRPPLKETEESSSKESSNLKPESEVVDRLRSAQKELLFWGSDPVVKSWMEFMMEMQTTSEMTPQRLAIALNKFGHLIVSMRRDVGYQFTQINEYHIARMILAPGVEEDRLLEEMRSKR